MKKVYVKPEVECINFYSEEIIATDEVIADENVEYGTTSLPYGLDWS